jgi:malonate transporter
VHAGTLVSALAPVLLILALGFAAGKHHGFDADQTRGLSHLALTYALPAALFLSMAHFKRDVLLEQAPIALVMLAGYAGLYLLLYWVLRANGRGKLEAALLGFTFTSSSVPVYGLTVLTPIYGKDTGSAVAGLVSLITNLAQVSVAVFLLESASSRSEQRVSVPQLVGRSALNPLVWAPVLGGVLALMGMQLSPYVAATLEPLAAAAAGVAIFASGLVMASHRVTLSPLIVIGSLIVMALQPLLFFLGMKIGDLSGVTANATVVAGAFPNATIAILFAQQYRTAEPEVASIMLITTVGMVAAIPLAILAGSLL